jgi:hypothetical protein
MVCHRHTQSSRMLVSRQASNVGYSLDSLMRASSVVNCQLIFKLISPSLPCSHLAAHGVDVGDAPVQALLDRACSESTDLKL